MEPQGSHDSINFFLGSQTEATDMGLNKDNSEETVRIAGKTDDSHRCFRE